MSTSTEEAVQGVSSPGIKLRVGAGGIWSFMVAAALAAFYLATTLYVASHRPFWFDELFTVHIARLPSWLTIWTALAHAVDSQPPIYYMVIRIFDKLSSNSELAVRLPSALAMVAGLLLTFDCARRLTDGLHGLIALAVLTCSFVPYYGWEARPYTITFMLSALALWVWTNTRLSQKWSAILFGAVLFVAVTIHYYAVLLIVPYAVYELFRWRPWQPPSQKLIAGVLGITVPAALLSPLILSFAHRFSARLGGHPAFRLRNIFSDYFPDGMFLLALIMIWIAWAGRNRERDVLQPMGPGESVGWLFLCIPLAGFVVAELKTNAFANRFFIGALPGIAVGFSCCLWRNFRNAFRVSLGVFLLLASAGVANQVAISRHPELTDRLGLQSYLGLEDSLQKDSKRFILFDSSYREINNLYMGCEYYSKRPKECILLLASDDAQKGSLIHGVVLNLAQYYPLQIWKLDDLKTHARDVALIEPAPATLDAVRLAGFEVEVRFSKPLRVVYLQ